MGYKKVSPDGEAFCREYLASSNATQSYINVYGGDNRRKAAVAASNLLKKPEIQEYLSELKRPLEEAAIGDRAKRVQFLWDLINNSSTRDADKLRAIDILCRMDGDYKVLPTDGDQNVDLSGMSDDELRKLLS